jgi:hypothetical protein
LEPSIASPSNSSFQASFQPGIARSTGGGGSGRWGGSAASIVAATMQTAAMEATAWNAGMRPRRKDEQKMERIMEVIRG